jgi:putative Mg2+ transporter-C (MgtC) family protein
MFTIADWNMIIDQIIKLALALLVGGMVGMEREMRDKAAGFRTLMFICAGSTLFTIFSMNFSEGGDPARIAAQIVSGIGFLGAGVIIREGGQVKGLTTASTIWLVAALGIGIGANHVIFSLAATLILLFVLWVFPIIESWIGTASETRTYQIVFVNNIEKFNKIDTLWKKNRLKVQSRKQAMNNNEMICTWVVSGRPKNHDEVVRNLYQDEDIHSFTF